MKLVYVPVMKCKCLKCKCLCANDSFILYFGVIRLQICLYIYLYITEIRLPITTMSILGIIE